MTSMKLAEKVEREHPQHHTHVHVHAHALREFESNFRGGGDDKTRTRTKMTKNKCGRASEGAAQTQTRGHILGSGTLLRACRLDRLGLVCRLHHPRRRPAA
jgi:hypothetical protein